jgi:hypothetical protein
LAIKEIGYNIMAEEMVLVPQSKLDELEVARKKLYNRLPETDNGFQDILNIIELQDVTAIMWELANTKWKKVT